LAGEFQGAARLLKAGEVSDIIAVRSGFAILTRFAVAPRIQDLDAERIKSLVSRGAVLDTIDISGMASANAALTAYGDKPSGWDHDPVKVCAVRTNSYNAAVERLGQQLPLADAQPPGRVRPVDLMHGCRAGAVVRLQR
jgi:hypothetical protein